MNKVAILGHLYVLYTRYSHDGAYLHEGKERLQSLAANLNREGVTTCILAGDYVHQANISNYQFLLQNFIKLVNADVVGLKSSHEFKGSSQFVQTYFPEYSGFAEVPQLPFIALYSHWKPHRIRGHTVRLAREELAKVRAWTRTTDDPRILIVPDLRWKATHRANEMRAILQDVDLLIVGDGEDAYHNYGWFHLGSNEGARVVMTGFAYGLKGQLGGLGSRIDITLDGAEQGVDIRMVPHCENWDSLLYKMSESRLRRRRVSDVAVSRLKSLIRLGNK